MGVGPSWSERKEKLKSTYPQLTVADLNYTESRKNEMLEKIKIKLGVTTQQLKAVIDTL